MGLIRNKITRNLKSLALLGLNLISPGGAAILMYHSVGDNRIFFTVKPERFKEQMGWLHINGYKVISLEELAGKISRREEVPERSVVLTFDDSFEDNYFNVFPVLKEYGFPAAVFIAADFIGKEQKNETTGVFFKTLNWQQIKEMHSSGLIDFEPHSCSHRRLTKMPLSEAESEILGSRRIIEENLHKSCRFFSYPRGSYSQGIIDILRANNFLAALTINSGRAGKNSNLLELPRQSVDSSTGKIQFLYKVK